MSYIIIYTTNQTVAKRLYNLEQGRKDRRQKPQKELFVLSLTGNSTGRGVVKVMRNNGFTLSYIASLLNKYPNEVYVWVAERLTLNQFPKICKKGGLWLGQRPGRRLIDLPGCLNVSKGELRKCKINYSLNLKEKV